ncbi:hypothetical protein VNI00_016388 [Paramarasmius palmivorus]|uniref:Cytochrome P450 n=1 Tax=Paramarasmius palmivorus TaxID=297713 RepID=A0AAW0BEM9_9AGAR
MYALDKLAERVAQGADRLNLSLWASQLALDAIGEATFGHEFGALEGHTDDLFRANKQLVYVSPRRLSPRLLTLGSRRFGDTSSKTLLIRAIQRYIPIELMAWLSNIKPSNDAIVTRTGGSIRRIAARDILAKAKQEAKGCELDRRRDILSVLVQCNNATEAKKRMSDEEVISQTVAIIQAGHSVTGAFMAWLFHELARHPEDQERIYQEIQDFRSKNGADAPLRAEDYEEMTYLTACLKENLRYHPALPTLAREATTGDIIPLAIPVVSPTTGKTITHIPVQKGQRVMLDFGSYQRLKHVWGEDADTWNPSRFLNQDRKLNFQYNVGMYANILSFSGGVQGCIGWRFALAEAQTIVIGILERLKLILPPEGIEIQGVRSGMNVPMVAGKWDEGMQVPLVLERREK